MSDHTPERAFTRRLGWRQIGILAALACASGVTAGEVTLQNDDGEGSEGEARGI